VARYQLFVADSGTREYDDNRDYDNSGKSLYFVYGAILIEQNAGAQLAPRLRELKRLTFGRPDVEVKSNWLRIPKERRRRYITPFGQRRARSQVSTRRVLSTIDFMPGCCVGRNGRAGSLAWLRRVLVVRKAL
jgi:hypothetical protein